MKIVLTMCLMSLLISCGDSKGKKSVPLCSDDLKWQMLDDVLEPASWEMEENIRTIGSQLEDDASFKGLSEKEQIELVFNQSLPAFEKTFSANSKELIKNNPELCRFHNTKHNKYYLLNEEGMNDLLVDVKTVINSEMQKSLENM